MPLNTESRAHIRGITHPSLPASAFPRHNHARGVSVPRSSLTSAGCSQHCDSRFTKSERRCAAGCVGPDACHRFTEHSLTPECENNQLWFAAALRHDDMMGGALVILNPCRLKGRAPELRRKISFILKPLKLHLV